MQCRCSRCGTRRSLAQHPDYYLRIPPCRTPGCITRTRKLKQTQRWRIDKWRLAHEVGNGAPRPCRCVGGYYHFPHRRGSKWCEHNPNWTAEDAKENF